MGKLLLTILAIGLHFHPAQGEERPLQTQAQIIPYQLQARQNFELQINLSLPAGYRAYADQFKIEVVQPEGFQLQKFDIQPLQLFTDPNTKKSKKGVVEKAILKAPMETPSQLNVGPQDLVLRLTYQACTKSYCLFPIKEDIHIPFEFVGAPILVEKKLWQMELTDVFEKGLLWTFIFVFLAGFLTSFTPCIFPMIPITIAVLGKTAHMHSKKKQWLLSLLYVLGIALTYAALGVFAAATGAMFGSFMSHPLVLSLICLIFLAMALSLMGAYELQAPLWIRNKFSSDFGVHGYTNAFISGVIAGIVASPCVGPVLVGILTFVAKSQNLWLGFWLLFVFAVGMGQLFLLIGISSQFTKFLPKSGAWMEGVKSFFGLLILAAFYYYLSLLIPPMAWKISLGVGLILFASLKGAFAKEQTRPFQKIWQGACWLILLGGCFFVISPLQKLQKTDDKPSFTVDANQWHPYQKNEFEAALKSGQPVLLDFFADWCVACKELEKNTFTSQSFQLAVAPFKLFRFDATNDSIELNQLKEKYGIVGLPTVLIFNKKGEWIESATVNEFLEAPEFITRIQKAF